MSIWKKAFVKISNAFVVSLTIIHYHCPLSIDKSAVAPTLTFFKFIIGSTGCNVTVAVTLALLLL